MANDVDQDRLQAKLTLASVTDIEEYRARAQTAFSTTKPYFSPVAQSGIAFAVFAFIVLLFWLRARR